MRLFTILCLYPLLHVHGYTQTQYSPAEPTFFLAIGNLHERAGCPGGTFQCPESLGPAFSDVCCQNGQSCALDGNSQPACCPSDHICTGVAPSGAPGSSPTNVVSYVPNEYFSFPYAPTSFADQGDCKSAKKACSRNYDVCVSNLGHDATAGLAVTVNVPGGGGTTVAGAQTDLGSSATAVCSSLSSEACSDLEATSCNSYSPGSAAGKLTTRIPFAFYGVLVAGVMQLFG